MLDALQPFLEDKKQTLALNGGDDPIRLILAYFSTDNQNIDELEKLKYNKALYRRLGWQDEEWFDVIRSIAAAWRGCVQARPATTTEPTGPT